MALNVMKLLNDATRRVGCSTILITHNLLQAAEFADTIIVMYGGEVVEFGPARTVVDEPRTGRLLGPNYSADNFSLCARAL